MSAKLPYTNCFHKLINDEYCENCGAMYYQGEYLIKHIKYNYPCELSPIKLCHEMINSNSLMKLNQIIQSNHIINKIYLEKRKEFKNLLKNMNTSLDNNSSTYFLSLLYMDLIFQNYTLEEIFMNNDKEISPYDLSSSSSRNIFPVKQCLLIAICCIVIASKFNEKDPHVPDLNSFIRVYNQNSKFYFIFSVEEIRETEVIILKLLKYKLNFYSLYQFITFFFANGILSERYIKEINANKRNKLSEKKILEKIYVKSREILDYIIDDFDKYYILFNGKDNYITALEILIWSIEHVLDIKITDEEEICYLFKLYNIDINYQKHMKIFTIINNININMNLNSDNYNDQNPITDIVNNIKDNYNFDYKRKNTFINSDSDIVKKYINFNKNNNNLRLMSSTNYEQLHNSERLSLDYRNKNYKTKYYFNTKCKNNNLISHFEDTQDISAINKINTLMSYDMNDKLKEENDENKDINIPDNSNNIDNDENTFQGSKNKYQYFGISRNSTNGFNFTHYIENENTGKNEQFKNYKRNYNEINPYSTKINIGNNYRYNNNKNNINNTSNMTFSKSWFNKNKDNNNEFSMSPKNILNKTKKIFDETNKSNNTYEESLKINKNNNKITNNSKVKKNIEENSFNYLINSYINKPNYSILKSMNNEKIEKNIIDDELSESNIVYKLKNKNYKDEIAKENSIIINNNIQINNYNYITKGPNEYNYYYNNSQQNISERENTNMNIDNYINKKYFNMNNTNKINNYYLLNKISKLKNKRKVNFKKNNFLGKNNVENIKDKENEKENKINNNNVEFISTIKKMENFKNNKEKNKNFLNLGSFETYFDYSSYSRRKNEDLANKKDYNIVKSINYKNSSYIENNENNFGKINNNLLFRMNDKLNKFNKELDISERYRKVNSEFNL